MCMVPYAVRLQSPNAALSHNFNAPVQEDQRHPVSGLVSELSGRSPSGDRCDKCVRILLH